ncbi:MAG: hypothetical protein H0T78_08585, partial [Longispora sp.]|nr:hypothetical protein [Longispora sp. (in: high G+C Gram-positive bacteria)]
MSKPPSPPQPGDHLWASKRVYRPDASGYPGVFQSEPGAKSRRHGSPRGMVLLGGLITVAVLLATATAVLYAGQRGSSPLQVTTRQERDLTDLRNRLVAADAELERTRRQLASAQVRGNDVAEQKKVVATCLRLTFEFLTAVSSADQNVKSSAQG